MIVKIEIDKSELEILFAKNKNRRGIIKLFSEVARVSRKGYHRIVMEEPLAEYIVKKDILDEVANAQIEWIGEKYAILSSQIEESTPLLNVVYGNKKITSEGIATWKIGHNNLLAGEFLEKTVLLAEGPYDREFYRLILEEEAKRIDFGHVNFFHEQGGGKTSSFEFKEHVKNNNRIVICICDSDRLVPGGVTGATYNNVLKESEELEYVGLVTCTPCHEVENFLPIEVIRILVKKLYQGSNMLKKLSELDELETIKNNQNDVKPLQCTWLYCDLKSGAKRSDMMKQCNNEQKLWISTNFDEYFNRFPNKKTPGFGTKIISKFINEGEIEKSKFIQFMNDYESGYWELHFSNWLSTLLWYGCGEEEKFT